MKEKLLMLGAAIYVIPQFIWEYTWDWFNGVESTPEIDPIHESSEVLSDEEFQ